VPRGPVLAWGSVVVLSLFAAGAALISSLSQPASAAVRLQSAINATFDSSRYVSTIVGFPGTRTIVNPPDLSESFQGGRVSEIVAGHTFYLATWYFAQNFAAASGSNCDAPGKFVELGPGSDSSAYSSYLTIRGSLGFRGERVTRLGDTYTVTKGRQAVENYVVVDGRVVQTTAFLPRRLTPQVRVRNLVTRYSAIGRAARIVVPPARDTIRFSAILLHGCGSS